MTDFDIQNELPDEINLDLEDLVEDRTARLNSLKEDSQRAIRESKDALRRYELSTVKDGDLLDQKIKDLVLSRGENLENVEFSSGLKFKKKAYDFCKNFGVDLYLRDAKNILTKHLEDTEYFKKNIIAPLQDKLYNQNHGLVILLEEEEKLREQTANTIALSQNTKEQYMKEIAGLNEELNDISQKMESVGGDYTGGTNYLTKNLNQTKRNKKELDISLQELEEKFIDLDYSIEEKEATILNAELVFKSGMQAYRAKASTLKRSLRLIQENDISIKGLNVLATNINKMLVDSENISQIEDGFGEAFFETNRRIQDRLSKIVSTKTPDYISSLRQGKVEIDYELSRDVQNRVNQYKTIA